MRHQKPAWARNQVSPGFTLLFLCWLALAAEALAQNTVTIRTNYYDLHGTTVRDLDFSLVRQRPWRENNGNHARTDWEIRWRYSTRRTETNCQLYGITTQVFITMTVPRWTNQVAAAEQVVRRWNHYIVNLHAHEYGHAQIALAAAEAIRRAAQAVKPQPNCDSLRQLLDQVCRVTLEDYRQREIKYDQTTRHGITQGAHFP